MIAAAPADGVTPDQRPLWRHFAFLLAAALILLRLVYLAFPNLFPEEAYYWNYSQHLDIGYLDHPPMIAWMIWLGTRAFGHSEFGVRIFAVLCSLVTTLFTFRLTRLLYGRPAAITGALLVQCLPFFFAAGWMMTPDAPLTACWAAMLYFLARVFFEGRASGWVGVGVFLGLGMISKYTIALLGPATLLFMALDAPSRLWFRRVAPYAGVLLSVVIFSPVILWNARHHWASFAFQSTGRVHESHRFALPQLIAAILLLISPLGVFLAVRGLIGRGEPDVADETRRRLRFAQVFTLTPLAVFVIFSLWHKVKLNWTGPLWLAVIPLFAVQLTNLRPPLPGRVLVASWRTTLVVLTLGYVAWLQYISFGLPGVRYSEKTELFPVGWSQMGHDLEAQRNALEKAAGKRALVVGLDRDFIASEAAFYADDPLRAVGETTGTHLFGGVSLMYAFWFPPSQLDGASLILVDFDRTAIESGHLRDYCGSLGPVEERHTEVDGKPVRTYFTRVATDYHSRGRER